ncbi:hypothetical protein Bca4012_017747 [Brassica carinata]
MVFEGVPCYKSDRGGAGIGKRRTDLWNPGELCEEEPSKGVGDSDAKGEGWVIGSEEHPSWGDSDWNWLWIRVQMSFFQSGWVVDGSIEGYRRMVFHSGQAKLHQHREGIPRGSCSLVLGDRNVTSTDTKLHPVASTGFLMPMVTCPGVDLLIPSKTTEC